VTVIESLQRGSGQLETPVQVTGLVILYEAFPPGQRGLVLGLYLLAGSLGPTIGPTLGGYLVQEYSWRAMFYLSLPTAVLSLILTPIRVAGIFVQKYTLSRKPR